MTVAANMNVGSASIAVYCSQARIIDGVSDGKISGARYKVICFQMLTGAGDVRVGVTGSIGDYRALSSQDTKASARQSDCAHWRFVIVLPNGQKTHSVQQPEGDEV